MKVYVVQEWHLHEDHWLRGIFDTIEKAAKYCDEKNEELGNNNPFVKEKWIWYDWEAIEVE